MILKPEGYLPVNDKQLIHTNGRFAKQMDLKLLACEILYRETCAAVARSPNRVDVEFLPKGLHDLGQEGMNQRLQEELAAVDQSQYDAILFGYGLCSNGLVGLTAISIPLVIPRAHDCITLFLGGKERYLDYFQSNPGVYFKTSGWIERGTDLSQIRKESIQEKSGMTQTYEELVEKYGEDNAKFLYEQLCDMRRNYGRITFIEMGIGPGDHFEQCARKEAEQSGWEFEKLDGDMTLMYKLLDGPWDNEEFLTVQPGHRVATSFDELIIKAEVVDSG